MREIYDVSSIFIIIAVIIIVSAVSFMFLVGRVEMDAYATHITIDFSESTSPFLNEIKKTYKANEEASATVTTNYDSNINNISIQNKEAKFDKLDDKTIKIKLDTTIRNEDSRETKLISIQGMTIDGKEFEKESNYEVLLSTEEIFLERTTQAEIEAKKANNLAKWTIIIGIILFILEQVKDIYFHKRDKKSNKKKRGKKR